jgi:hypothetical protein
MVIFTSQSMLLHDYRTGEGAVLFQK